MATISKPVWLAAPGGSSSLGETGTKAFNLSKLVQLGFNVPPCFFVATLGSRTAKFPSADDYLAAIDAFSKDLDRLLPSQSGWAVRSSATVEDLPGESHAGRFETLFIGAAGELAAAVKAVWDSAALAGIGPESMGVVIQRLVDADFAGVAFSHDPTRDVGGTVIEGVPGNAAKFVDGEISPWRIRPAESDITLPAGFGRQTVEELDAGVRALAAELDMDVDTEWAVEDGELYWLQVRPMTGAIASAFTVPEQDKAELKGLWVRINHSFAPQASLVASMNPGGYFDGPGWKSKLVNGFHYIQEEKRAAETVPQEDFDGVLDEWDAWEAEFEPLYEQLTSVDLPQLALPDLWLEILRRIELSQKYFANYSDRRFLEIRERSQQAVDAYIEQAMGDSPDAGSAAAKLLGQLDSLTEEKQRQLVSLASKYAATGSSDIRDSEEWQTFMREFGSESPTTHLFYLPTLQETPELVLEMLKQLSQAQTSSTAVDDWRSVAASVAARLSAADKPGFETALARLRRCLLRTENDDYALSKCTWLVREAWLTAGRALVESGQLADADDVFHLTGPELDGALTGDAALDSARIRERKDAFRLASRLSPPPMIVNGRVMQARAEKARSTLKGTPASPGVASGTVLVLNNPFSCAGKKLPQNSVVVAPVVTPSLAYSLLGCAAVITEIGGLASHGAIVAREMAIPAVVGVSKARALLQTGSTVTVDGSTGEINLLGTQE